MPIDYNKLRSLTARELISALIKDDFYLSTGRGNYAASCRGGPLWPPMYGKGQAQGPAPTILAVYLMRSVLRDQRGSHQRYRHPDGRRVTVSFHKPSDTFPPKTLKTIIEEQACWTEEDLKRLRLI